MNKIAQRLAEFVVGLSGGNLPEDVADMAKKCIFDGLGNLYCGRYTAMGKLILKYLDAYSLSAAGEAKISLIGGGTASKEDAMAAYTVMARCADLDDGHRFAMGHPGSVLIPAVLTVGELKKKTAEELLAAVTAGYDVYCRIGAAVNPTSYRERGFDATGICGAAACAAAIGKLYDLNLEQMKNALGIAALFSGGLIEYQNDGSMGKVLCGCFAVRNGMEAVQLAERGFTGPDRVFEGSKGFFQAFSNDPDDFGVLLNLGTDFKIKETYFKTHACMRGLHAAVDALLDIRKRENLAAADIAEMEVFTTPFVSRLSNPRPTTLIGAQCSLEFVLAAAMTWGHISREEVLAEALSRESVFELASRIKIRIDQETGRYVELHPSHWAAVRMAVRTKDGRIYEQWRSLPRGEAENPFDWEALDEKFRRMIAETPFEPYGEMLYREIRHFEEVSDFGGLTAPWEKGIPMFNPNKKIPCVYMRGGTSKAVFFHDSDLPKEQPERDRVILGAFGSPDRRQIDGMGGANTSTSKVAIIKKSTRPGIDVDYDFGQVDINSPIVGKTMNCGNISSAVGPFAVDEGLVEAVEPVTEVHIYNTNTQKEIIAQVPVKAGRAVTEGDFSIDGVPGTAAKVTLKFVAPQGAASGRLLPTGNARDTIEIEGKVYEYSFVDAANPVIFVRPESFGIKGTELPAEFNALPNCREICRILEIIRGTGAVALGFARDLEDAEKNSQTLPKIAFITSPKAYTAGSGKKIEPADIDLTGRLFSVGMKMIDAYMGTGAICTVTAANTPGTIVNELAAHSCKTIALPHLRIGHPWGVMDVCADLQPNADGTYSVLSGNLDRTARRIMEGYVYVRN